MATNVSILKPVPVWLALTVAVALCGCESKRDCPDGMQKVSDRSSGKEVWCRSADGSRAQWTELHSEGGPRRQLCAYSGGNAEGSYFAWFPNGKVWIEGVYRGGAKAGKWAQYNEDGAVIAKAEYRFGRFVAGAPVGRMARCEELKL